MRGYIQRTSLPALSRLLTRTLLLVTPLVACRPELGVPRSIIADPSPRILAIRADPPESTPGTDVIYSALVVAHDGLVTNVADLAITWGACIAPKPADDPSIVSSACLQASSLQPSADVGQSAHLLTPIDACALFGPEPPPGGFRPRDADGTGGYFVPIGATLASDESFFLERVTCTPGDAPVDLARQFSKTYRANENPKLFSFTVPGEARPGARIDLQASWGSEDAETYVWFDHAAQAIVSRRESMAVSWFATEGAFEEEQTGRAEDDPSTTSDNAWTAPTDLGAVHLFVVLHDSRGGVAFQTHDVVVGNGG